jgi:heptosyltransferase I
VSEAGDRFLIVRLGALGDVIHGIPVAAALRRAIPTARIDWLVDPRYVELLGCVTAIDDVIALDPLNGVAAVLTAIRHLRRQRYTAAIDLQGLIKSAVLARFAGAQRTVGFARGQLREPVAHFLYTTSIDVAGATHVINRNLALLSAVGVTSDVIETPLNVPSTAAGEQVSRQFGAEYVVLNGGAAWPNKRWPPERFGALGAALYARFGLPSVVLWGPGEQDLAAAIVAASSGAATAAPRTSIVETLAIVSGARLVVSGDTGPVHLAGAVRTPVVGIYGPTNPLRNGPWSSDDVVVSRYGGCTCHYQRRCHMPSRCIDTITVADVVDAAERRMTKTP